jgi:hypothetical protein
MTSEKTSETYCEKNGKAYGEGKEAYDEKNSSGETAWKNIWEVAYENDGNSPDGCHRHSSDCCDWIAFAR